MRLDRLFHVLVVTGASSTVGIAGCGDEENDATQTLGGACNDVCKPSATDPTWTDCNGCCCWLPVGATASAGSPICGEEPCCSGRGREAEGAGGTGGGSAGKGGGGSGGVTTGGTGGASSGGKGGASSGGTGGANSGGTGGASSGGSGGSSTGGTGGSGGGSSTGGAGGTGGGTGGTGGSGSNACATACVQHDLNADWWVCNGCCCWLAPGVPGLGLVGCPTTETCCAGRGR